eukprot:c14882_g1_i2 orf=313-1191(+)
MMMIEGGEGIMLGALAPATLLWHAHSCLSIGRWQRFYPYGFWPSPMIVLSTPRFQVHSQTHYGQEYQSNPFGRRLALTGFVAAEGCGLLLSLGKVGAKEAEVGAYLPSVPSKSGFVQFQATSKDTPALRAGNVEPYRFLLPTTWKQARVANILSGNYCQPKCAEPWVEVKFENENQGTAQVVASPMIRLTNKPNAKIEEIGNPEKLIAALGPFVTGNSYDPDEIVETHVEKRGGQTYYTYRLETPYARTGSHNLAAATAKGNTVVLFVVSANDKQWSSSEGLLKSILASFQI